mgnify:CR=1 FL=1
MLGKWTEVDSRTQQVMGLTTQCDELDKCLKDSQASSKQQPNSSGGLATKAERLGAMKIQG